MTGAKGLAIVLALNALVFAVLWLRRPAPPPAPAQPTPTDVAAESVPELGPATPEGEAAVAALLGEDPDAQDAARRQLATTPDVPALVAGLTAHCSGELADRAAVLAEAGGLRSDQARALAVPLLDRALGPDPDCAARALRALFALVTSTALDGGAATRLVSSALEGLSADDGRAVPLLDLLDRAAPEASGWPDRFETWAMDASLHPWARGVACRAVIRRRVAPERVLGQRSAAPGPVQRCLLLPFAAERVTTARALLAAPDIDVRLDALATLFEFGEPEDVPALLVRLSTATSAREQRALVETAGYLVQLHPEQADALLGTEPAPDTPAGRVRARFDAAAPPEEGLWADHCDVVAGRGTLQDALDRAAAVGSGGRLCLVGPVTGPGVGAPDLTVLNLTAQDLPAELSLPRGVAVAVGDAAVVRDGASELRLSADSVLPAAGVRLWQSATRPAETRGPRGQAGAWHAADTLEPASVTRRLGPPPARAPRPLSIPRWLLPPPQPAREVGGGPWVLAVGTGDVGVRVPLRAGDWLATGDSVLFLSGYPPQP